MAHFVGRPWQLDRCRHTTATPGMTAAAKPPLWSAFHYALQRSLSAGCGSSVYALHSPNYEGQAHTTKPILLSRNRLCAMSRCNKVDGTPPIYLASRRKGLRPLPLSGLNPLSWCCCTSPTIASPARRLYSLLASPRGRARPLRPKRQSDAATPLRSSFEATPDGTGSCLPRDLSGAVQYHSEL